MAERFAYDPTISRYRSLSTGRLVAESAVRGGLDQVITAGMQSARSLSDRLIAGDLSLAEWQSGMMAEIRRAHVIGATVARGGQASMSQADYGFAGQRIREQYGYLREFAAQIQDGRQPLNNVIAGRAEMYAEAGRATHRAMETRMALHAGYMLGRNVLGAADHCPGCLGATALGVVPIRDIPPVGTRDCLSRCHCVVRPVAEREAAAA